MMMYELNTLVDDLTISAELSILIDRLTLKHSSELTAYLKKYKYELIYTCCSLILLL